MRLLLPDEAVAVAPAVQKCNSIEETDNLSCGTVAPGDGRKFDLGGGVKMAVSTTSGAGAMRRPASHSSGLHAMVAAPGCSIQDATDPNGVNLCVTFALNSADLTPKSREMLDVLAASLQSPEIGGRPAVIEGFTDATGAEDLNRKLSEQRANAVRDYLAGKGVATLRLSASGYGSDRLLPGHAATDPANRRVEVELNG